MAACTVQYAPVICADQSEGATQTTAKNHLGFEGIRLCDWTGGGDLRDESEDVIGCGDARRDVLTNGRVSSTN